MFSAMGADVGDEASDWRGACARWFAERISAGDGLFAAFVVDDPDLGVVSSAVGICHSFAPSPTTRATVRGELFNVSTDPRRRRLGLARLCVVALLDWFTKETDASVVTLNATSEGIGLYTSLGFAESRYPGLRLRIER